MTAATKTRRFYLTPRDVEMLASINIARYITPQALEWLHFPTWRDRWAAAQAAGTPEAYRPAPHLYRRLSHLVDHEIVYRLRRPIERSRDTFGRAPDIYMLAALGARLLAENHEGTFIEDCYYTRKRERSFQNVEHGAMIGQVYAAIRSRFEAVQGLELTDWQGEHLTAKDYDTVQACLRRSGGTFLWKKAGIQPDATCVFHGFDKGERISGRVFIEVDRGTRPTQTWADKIAAYDAYMGSGALMKRYGVNDFTLLVITTTEAQRMTLMQATAGVLGKGSKRYLFAIEGDVHPDRLGASWRYIDTVKKTSSLLRPIITTGQHTVFV
jgi:hypothetical protein